MTTPADIVDLKEDLTALNEVLPKLPTELRALTQRGHELAQAASTLLHEVEEGRQEASGLLANVRATLPDFTAQVEMLEKRLETAIAGVEKAWTEDDAQLDEGEQALEASVEQTSTARAELLRVLAEAGSKVDQASAEGDAIIDRVESAARDGHTRIKAAADSFTRQVDTLQAMVTKTAAALAEANQAFIARAHGFIDTLTEDADRFLDELESKVKGHGAHLFGLRSTIQSGLVPIVESAETRLRDNVNGPVATIGRDAVNAVKNLVSGAEFQEEAVARQRKELNEALQQLGATVVPLPQAVQDIHAALLKMRQQ